MQPRHRREIDESKAPSLALDKARRKSNPLDPGGACDGFAILVPYMPGGLADVVDLVVPELQRRELFRTEYEGTTLRENLGLPRPENKFAKTAQQRKAG